MLQGYRLRLSLSSVGNRSQRRAILRAKFEEGTFLVAQWLRMCLPMQEIWLGTIIPHSGEQLTLHTPNYWPRVLSCPCTTTRVTHVMQQRRAQPKLTKTNLREMNLAVVGRVGNGKQWLFTRLWLTKMLTAEVPRRQKTKGVTIVSHGSIKSFGFEPVFFLISFQKIAWD